MHPKIKEILSSDKKKMLLLVGLNLVILSILLFQTANNTGPLYEYLKPEMYEENYILNDQYIGDITYNGKMYNGVLIMEVSTLDNSTQQTLYFANENKIRVDLSNNDTITVTWVKQKLDDPYIRGVSRYYDNVTFNTHFN